MMTFQFENGMYLYIHLKNVAAKKVKQKKRWSQILYTSLLLEMVQTDAEFVQNLDNRCYLLLMDGDTQFTKKDVDLMRSVMLQDERIGAVCGRIVPDCANPGSNPLVWFQKFEYAAGHWFQKTAEHMFGSVLCWYVNTFLTSKRLF
jgi:chitin synthase